VTTDFLYGDSSIVQELSGGSVQANLLLRMTTRGRQSRAAWFRKKRPIAGEAV
jgi:hypothetical protein